MNNIICPVPKNQRPLNEFNSFRNAWIVSWPLLERHIFYKNLIISWILTIPISSIISYGSDYLKHNIFHLSFISLNVSLFLPLLLLLRQWLSWIYLYKRLNSENIEYEESGWYDGQIWEKPLDWRAKDILIAQHQVKPLLNHLEKLIIFIVLTISFSLIFILSNFN